MDHITMHIDHDPAPHQVIHVRDGVTGAALRAAVDDVTHEHVVIDLRDLRFIGADFVAAVARSVLRLRQAGGQVAVICDDGFVQRLLRTVGLDHVVEVQPDPVMAVAAWSSDGASVSPIGSSPPCRTTRRRRAVVRS